ARALFACDELSGFLVACALVTPQKKLAAVEVESVRKKLKSPGFARNVNRDDIVTGAAELGVELDDHIAFVREAMVGIAGELGLGGAAGRWAGTVPARRANCWSTLPGTSGARAEPPRRDLRRPRRVGCRDLSPRLLAAARLGRARARAARASGR